MFRIIIIFIAIIPLVDRAYAQQEDMVSSLLAIEKEIYFTKNDTTKNHLVLDKVEVYFKNDSINADLLKEIKRVNRDLFLDSISLCNFLWNASLVAHVCSDYNNSKKYLNDYFIQSKDSSNEFILLSILVFHEHDTERVENLIKTAQKRDTSFSHLECLNTLEKKSALKGKRLMVFSSYLIPGMGTAISGRPIKGIVSLLVTGSLGAATFYLAASGLYLNAAFISFPWFYKIYHGQTRLTRKVILDKESKRKHEFSIKCEKQLAVLLDKYPIKFKSFK